MPRHARVTNCLHGGPVSKTCTCQHCQLCVCEVCGAYEGGLTTDCPGAKISFDRQQEVYETNLDYTDDRGWHQGEPSKRREPHFEDVKLPPSPPHVDPRTVIAPGVNWAAVDRNASLQHELSLRAIAWVLADRSCDDQSAKLSRVEDEADDHLYGKDGKNEITETDEPGRDLFARLEREKIDFLIACQRVERCDDEFRQAARNLVAALESSPLIATDSLAGHDATKNQIPSEGAPVQPKIERKDARHYAYIEADFESMRRGGSCRTARCLCGWRGPQRGTLELAADDALIHEHSTMHVVSK